MREQFDDLDQRLADALRRDAGAADRRARDLWPSLSARLSRQSVRWRRMLWTVPALAAAAVLTAVVWTGAQGPFPDAVASPPPSGSSSALATGTSAASPAIVGSVTLTASPSRYSPLMSSAFGIHITAADAQGNPVEGDWTASWGYFLPATELEGGAWQIGDPQDKVKNSSEAYWSFISSDVPDTIQVRFAYAGGVIVLTLEKDPQWEYFVRVAAPRDDGLQVVYFCWTQVLPVGNGVEWPDATVVTDRTGMEEYCRDIFNRYIGTDGTYAGGFHFLDAFSAYLTEEELGGVAGYAQRSLLTATPYDVSSFDGYDLLLIPHHETSRSITPEVRQVFRTGDTLTVEAAASYPQSGSLDTEEGYWLLAVQIPKGAADGARIEIRFTDETEDQGHPTPSPAFTAIPGNTVNAFGLPDDRMVPRIVDENGMLRDGWREIVDALRTENNRKPMEYPDHPSWPVREATLTSGDLALWDTPLNIPEEEALASIEAAMAASMGAVPVRTSDSSGDDGTRVVQWKDGTRADFSNGALYALKTVSDKTAMLPGLAVGGRVAWFIEAYGRPRVSQDGSTLSWSFGNNPFGNDHLFVTAQDGVVTSIAISLIQ